MLKQNNTGHIWPKWFACIILCFCCIASHAQYFVLDSGKKSVKLPFLLTRNMIVVPLIINSKGPFNFILDTGVGLMVITDPSMVDSININTKRNMKLMGYGNQNGLEAWVTSQLNVTMPGLHSQGVAAAIFKKDHFGLSNYAGMPIHGLLGYDFFSQLAIKINFGDSTLTIAPPGKIKPFRKGLKLAISVEENKPYLTTCVTLASGIYAERKVIIDLGAGHPLSLENTKPDSCFQAITANLGFGLTGPVTGSLSRINEIDLGKYKLKNVLTAFPDSSRHLGYMTKRDGNLGLDVLKRFSLIFDYHNGALYLKPNYHFKEPFEHDMSGLEYYAVGKDLKRIIVSRVEPNSPAEEVGIVENDEITSINFKRVDKMSIIDIDNLFKSRPDRSLLVEISRGDKKSEMIVLTLKRRI